MLRPEVVKGHSSQEKNLYHFNFLSTGRQTVATLCDLKDKLTTLTLKTDVITTPKILLAVTSGLLLTGSFPDIGVSWLSWFALVPLLISMRDLSSKESFRLGMLAGWVHYLTLLYWIAGTLKTFGHLPLYLGIPIFFLFCTYLALYMGIFAWASTRFSLTPIYFLFIMPVLWVSLEYIRSFLLSGFPWELMGYAQFNVLHLIQISDICGVYGVSFLVVLCNAVIFMAFLAVRKRAWQGEAVQKRPIIGSVFFFGVIFTVVWFYGTWRLGRTDRLSAGAPSARISIIQGNIDQTIKWDPAFQSVTTDKYIRLSVQEKKDKPDLIVWPETATPFYYLSDRVLSDRVQKGIQKTGAAFLIGSPSFVTEKNRVKYYNSAYLLGPNAQVLGKYDKSHLVPFGEYVPFQKWLPFLGKIVEQVGDFWPGKRGRSLRWGDYRLGIQICYEIIFPELARAMVKNNASLLINLTNDAWYGKTSAPFQHFSMAVFRAVENRRTLIRSANTGISGFIDPAGRIIAATRLFEDAVMTRSIPLIDQKSIYTRIGDLFARICLAITLLVGLQTTYRRRKKCLSN